MSLVDKKSMYDRHHLTTNTKDGQTIGRKTGEGPDPTQGDWFSYNGAPNIKSPFKSMNSKIGDDHLVDLLKDYTINSNNSGLSYDPVELRKGTRPFNGLSPEGDQDFDGVDGGQGTFTIGHLQGKKVNGRDLHEHLLVNDYAYHHGTSTALIKGSPANVGDFQDFIDSLDPLTEYPGSNPTLGQFGGPYKTTGPSEGRY